MGTAVDKAKSSFFKPTRYYWRGPLEILYVQSAAARKFANIPIDDAFLRWHRWEGDDSFAAENMKENELKHLVPDKLSEALKAGVRPDRDCESAAESFRRSGRKLILAWRSGLDSIHLGLG